MFKFTMRNLVAHNRRLVGTFLVAIIISLFGTLGALAGMLSAVMPARRAAHLNVLDAIASD